MKSKQPKNIEDDFSRFLESNPNATFAEYYVATVMRKIALGKSHSTLGGNLYMPGPEKLEMDFHSAGIHRFRKLVKRFDIKRDDTVIDYGCGSLRLGIHFIDYLDAGHYCGLDVTRDFIDMGVKLIGDELIRAKDPFLAPISAESISVVREKAADIVFSNAVCMHVHPNEINGYLENLGLATVKPGAFLAFDAKTCPQPTRYGNRWWAWPLSFFVEKLGAGGLHFVDAEYETKPRTVDDNPDLEVRGTNLVFQRPE